MRIKKEGCKKHPSDTHKRAGLSPLFLFAFYQNMINYSSSGSLRRSFFCAQNAEKHRNTKRNAKQNALNPYKIRLCATLPKHQTNANKNTFPITILYIYTKRKKEKEKIYKKEKVAKVKNQQTEHQKQNAGTNQEQNRTKHLVNTFFNQFMQKKSIYCFGFAGMP